MFYFVCHDVRRDAANTWNSRIHVKCRRKGNRAEDTINNDLRSLLYAAGGLGAL